MTVNRKLVASSVDVLEGANHVPFNDSLCVQTLASVTSFSTARKDQNANFPKWEKILVVWDDDVTLLIVRTQGIEVQTMNLLHPTLGPVDDEEGGHV